MASNMILHLIVSLLPFVSQETIRKLMLGSLVVFVEPGSTTQLGFFFLVCLLALVAHLHVKPFKANLDNILQGNALFAIVITVFFAIFKMSKFYSSILLLILFISLCISLFHVFFFSIHSGSQRCNHCRRWRPNEQFHVPRHCSKHCGLDYHDRIGLASDTQDPHPYSEDHAVCQSFCKREKRQPV